MQTVRGLLFVFVDALARWQKRGLLLLVDVALAPLALFLTLGLIHNNPAPMTEVRQMAPVFVLLPAISGLISAFLGIPKIKLNAYESQAVLKTGVFALILACGLAVLRATVPFSMPTAGLILFGLVFFLTSVAARMVLLHGLLWVLRNGKPRTRVLIYGAGTTGMQLAAALRAHPSVLPVAFIDDNPALHSLTVAGMRVLPPDRVSAVAQQHDIDRVLLAMPSSSPARQAQIARNLQALGLKVLAFPSFAQLAGVETLVDHLTPVLPDSFLGRDVVNDVLPEGSLAFQGKTILVSGAGGSVGSELCRQLLRYRPRRIVLFEVSEIALYTLNRELGEAEEAQGIEVVPVLGSVTDSRMARMVMDRHAVDVVFHAAAYKHVPLVEANPIAGLANNVLGTRTFADAAKETGVGRFILVSTDKAVRPTNIMGASKRLAEIVVQDLARRSPQTRFSIVRFGNVLGSSGSVVPLFNEQIARGGPVTLTHEDVTRYFMTIAEAARLVLLAGAFGGGDSRGSDVFVLDMGTPVRIRDLAEQMIRAAGCTVRDETHPNGDIEIKVIGLRPGEKMHEELLIGAGLLTTPHPKILRAEEGCLSELEVATALRELRTAVAAGDQTAARAVAEAHVEGFAQAAADMVAH